MLNVSKKLNNHLYFFPAADELIDFGFINILLSNLMKEDKQIVHFHLQTLTSLLYGIKGKMIALEAEAFSVFVSFLTEYFQFIFCILFIKLKLNILPYYL